VHEDDGGAPACAARNDEVSADRAAPARERDVVDDGRFGPEKPHAARSAASASSGRNLTPVHEARRVSALRPQSLWQRKRTKGATMGDRKQRLKGKANEMAGRAKGRAGYE